MRTGFFTRTILSLRGKVMLVVALGMALVFAVMAVVVFEMEHRLVERQLVENYRESVKSFAAMLSRPARTLDFQMIQELLDHKTSEEHIRFAVLRDSQGEVVASAGEWPAETLPVHGGEGHLETGTIPGGAREIRAPGDLLHAEGHVFEVDAPVPGLRLAAPWTVHLGVDTVQANREVIANTKRIVLLSGIVLVGSLVIMFLIDRRLRRIFRDLIAVTCRMASGDLSLRVDIRTGDELQVLGESFNAMANALREKEDQIRSYAENLETRVRERTEALLSEKQKLGAILGAIRAGLILYDPALNVVWANDLARDLLDNGRELAEPMWRELFRGPGGVESMARRVLEEGVALEGEKQVEDAKGESRYFQISGTPIRTEGGEVLQALLLLRDVSDNRRLERRLQQASKMVAIGELAGGVAHEINTPVGVVIAKSEFLLERLRKNGPSKDVDDLEKILKNAQRIAAITRGLLSFSRESGTGREEISVNALVEETVTGLLDQLSSAGVQVETSLAPCLPAIRANPEELQQVLVNLLTNALDAMNGKTGAKELRVATSLEGDQVTIRVRDTGCGIPAALRERVFEPFFSTKGVGKGTGLGLAISLGIVKAHGGRITVESAVGEHTTFTVELPVRATVTSSHMAGRNA